MHRLINQLVVYRRLPQDGILAELADVCAKADRLGYDFATAEEEREELKGQVLSALNRLLDLATGYGFDGNLWQSYVAFLLATTETPFTLVCEKHGAGEGSVNLLAQNDLDIFRQLLHYDFTPLERALKLTTLSAVSHYQAVAKAERIYNKSVSDKVQELSRLLAEAETGDAMFNVVTDFYRRYGVGMFGLNKAFRLSPKAEDGTELLEAITTTGDIKLSDLVGYESQKKRLRANTEAFVEGRRANNVLLYGDAGTGKSTSIKAILNEYYDRGLRMIEVYKHEFRYLSRIIAAIKNRNYRFIIYMDDLSFEEFEIEYKYLKAVIEGGLEVKPDNVLIYATSNRRHLIRETWQDRPDMLTEDMHQTDTVQEKLSLAGRFGLSIGYFLPKQQEYFDIVKTLARRHSEITLTDEELEAGARRWEMSHSGISGRTAQQYVNSLLSGGV